MTDKASETVPSAELEAMIAEADTGGRQPNHPMVANLLVYVALAWSLFQLYVSSPLVLEFTPWMHESVVKQFHLTFSPSSPPGPVFISWCSATPWRNDPATQRRWMS
jgi:hypothetical protein